MLTPKGWAAVAGALISCGLGVASLLNSDRRSPREPQWAGIVAPLRRAPIAARAVTALALDAGTSPEQAVLLLREAAWQRPDLRLALAEKLPPALHPDAFVTVGAASPPSGWHPVWRSEALRLWLRDRP